MQFVLHYKNPFDAINKKRDKQSIKICCCFDTS